MQEPISALSTSRRLKIRMRCCGPDWYSLSGPWLRDDAWNRQLRWEQKAVG